MSPLLLFIACAGSGSLETSGEVPGGEPEAAPDDSGGGGPGETGGEGGGPGETGGGDTLGILAFGDAGQDDADQGAVAAAAAGVCAELGCDLALLLGDNFYPDGVEGDQDPQWESKFIDVYAALEIPFYSSLGNHDYAENLGRPDPETGEPLFEIDPLRAANQIGWSGDARWNLPANSYAFDVEGIRFVGLDTTILAWGVDESNLPGESVQYELAPGWLAHDGLTIAFGHHPYRSNGKHGDAGSYDGAEGSCAIDAMSQDDVRSGACFEGFFERHVCGAADLYLSGHDHSLQYLDAPDGCDTQLIVSGAASKYDEGFDLRDDNPSRFQHLGTGFFWLGICPEAGEVGELRAYDASGALLFQEGDGC